MRELDFGFKATKYFFFKTDKIQIDQNKEIISERLFYYLSELFFSLFLMFPEYDALYKIAR